MQERRGRFQQGFSVANEPVLYLLFDLLQLDESTLLTQPFDRRRTLLEQLALPDPERITVVPSFTHTMLTHLGLSPDDLLARAAAAGYERVGGQTACVALPPRPTQPRPAQAPFCRAPE